jgi:pimeloyl-ACP methyl ester carboxylesterase
MTDEESDVFTAGPRWPTVLAAAPTLAREARIRVLDGHGHCAYRTDPVLVAAIIREFIAP